MTSIAIGTDGLPVESCRDSFNSDLKSHEMQQRSVPHPLSLFTTQKRPLNWAFCVAKALVGEPG